VRTYVVAADRIDIRHREAAVLAQFALELADEETNCHELADAIEAELAGMGWRRCRGRCGLVDHSWFVHLETNVVLDPYRPGCEPPVLLIDPCVALEYVEEMAR
jgi:hypothetical protein